MFKLNSPNFDSASNGSNAMPPQRLNNVQFESLDAFSDWIDAQLVKLEDSHESFATITSVRGFFGR